jgi:hypothetical protein
MTRGRRVFMAVSLLAFLGPNSVSAEASFYKDAGRGWHWYEKLPTPIEDDLEDKDRPVPTPQPSSPPTSQPPTQPSPQPSYQP